MTNKDRFLAYLRAYESKDIERITAMFSEDIRLRDWQIAVSGKSAAVFETQSNFNAVHRLEIQVLQMFEAEESIAAELKIRVNDTETLYVVDVLDFDKQGKISAIRAFLGRGDA